MQSSFWQATSFTAAPLAAHTSCSFGNRIPPPSPALFTGLIAVIAPVLPVPAVLCAQQLAPGCRPGKAEDAWGKEAFLTHCRRCLIACGCTGEKQESKHANVHCCKQASYLTALAFPKA